MCQPFIVPLVCFLAFYAVRANIYGWKAYKRVYPERSYFDYWWWSYTIYYNNEELIETPEWPVIQSCLTAMIVLAFTGVPLYWLLINLFCPRP